MRTIARQLGVAKSSVSVWVRDVSTPPTTPPPPKPPPGRPRRGPVIEGEGKVCGRCRRELTLESFNRAGEGLQHWCRDCFKTYFRARGDLHARQVRNATTARIVAAKAFLLESLAQSSCADCGEDEIAVLEFDHVGAKRGNVTSLMFGGASIKQLKEELEQCEVVCACCHRRRTARRGRWGRWTGDTSHWEAWQRRNYAYLAQVFDASGCLDCGERDPLVLEFDHVGAKESNIAELAAGASFQRLKAEIAMCEVRCCNCHRLVTIARRGGGWRGIPAWLAPIELD